MTSLNIIIIVCLAVIFSYLFDAFARKTKFPSVLLLIIVGIILRSIVDTTDYAIPNLDQLIPTLGTIGLIFIVLEGALELEISKEKTGIILTSLMAALVVMLGTTFSIYYILENLTDLCPIENLLMSIPFAVISSAVAIPSSSSFPKKIKEFIVYESTFSDILGIIFFNFVMNHYNDGLDEFRVDSFYELVRDIFLVIIIALIVTFLLMKMMQKLKQKVKFFLILSMLILSYALGKSQHLSALIIVFIFGLFMNNASILIPKFLRGEDVDSEKSKKDLYDFHVITAETTFITKTFFFLFFGFSIELSLFADFDIYLFGFLLLAAIVLVRSIYYSLFHYKTFTPTSFIAPRGLISILLFTQIPKRFTDNSPIDQNELLIVILGSMIWMLAGILRFAEKEEKTKELH